MSESNSDYIWRDDKNVPYVTGTRTKVVQIALDHIAYGWNAEEIAREHPYLSLAQVHCALAYYYANKQELDQDIANRKKKAEELRPLLEDPALAERLRKLKRERSQ